jgi:hypothetical protein
MLRRKEVARGTVSAAALAMVLAGCSAASAQSHLPSPTPTPTPTRTAQSWHFASRPDLTPPVITSTTTGTSALSAVQADEGHDIFLGPKDLSTGVTMQGELIADARGNPVWVNNSTVGTFSFREQTYQGKPVLTYWVGNSTSYGHGDIVILDNTYTQIAAVTTGGTVGAHQADMHESDITPQGTMLLTSYPEVQADLSSIGGPKNGWVLEGVAEEVDIATGKVLFEWNSLDHVPITDTYQPIGEGDGTKANPFDYFHINSVSLDGPDQFLISSRHTHTIYEVARATGDLTWQLGGKQSSFTFGANATFAWQHDARRQADGTLTLFDNEASPTSSRGLRLSLDMSTMTATMVTQFLPPTPRMSSTQGNVQVLADGNVFVGWGSEPFYSEYTASGQLILDNTFSAGTSYRAYRAPWVGMPKTSPDTVLTHDGSTTTASVSWNGATQVASWKVLTGSSADDATQVATVARTGFETTIPVPNPGTYVEVQALDAAGKVLGSAVAK